MKRVTFITTLVSPFQIEIANLINKKAEIEYTLVFTKISYKGRGKHWNSIKEDNKVLII